MIFGFGYGDSFGKIGDGINAAIRNWEIVINSGNFGKLGSAANRLKKEFERLGRFAKVHFLLLSEFFIHINREEVRLGAHGDTVVEANIIQGELVNKLEFLWRHAEELARGINPRNVGPTNINNSILVYKDSMLPLFGEITNLVGREESDLHKLFDGFKSNPSREARELVKDVATAEKELGNIIT